MSRSIRFCAIFMAMIMSNIPHLAWGAAAQEMISTTVVVEDMSRAQAQSKVEEILNRSEVRSELAKRGVSTEEINGRLASLSDSELRQLAGQMDQAMYGGDGVVGILIIVVLVLLIIFLVKRV